MSTFRCNRRGQLRIPLIADTADDSLMFRPARAGFVFLICLAALCLGCQQAVNLAGPYRMDIQQGNFVTQEMVSELRPGMSREQVRFILGTPLLADIFHADRWDYVFVREHGTRLSRGVEQRRLVVHFADGKLARVEGDVVPRVQQGGEKAGEPAK